MTTRSGKGEGGRPAVIDLELAAKLYAEGKTQKQVGEYFGTSQQAAWAALQKLRKQGLVESSSDKARLPPWPWKMKTHHVEGSNALYRLMQAYRKHAAGLEVTPRELRDANALRNAAQKWGMVISYRADIGFFWTKPRPGEEGQMFVQRD